MTPCTYVLYPTCTYPSHTSVYLSLSIPKHLPFHLSIYLFVLFTLTFLFLFIPSACLSVYPKTLSFVPVYSPVCFILAHLSTVFLCHHPVSLHRLLSSSITCIFSHVETLPTPSALASPTNTYNAPPHPHTPSRGRSSRHRSKETIITIKITHHRGNTDLHHLILDIVKK